MCCEKNELKKVLFKDKPELNACSIEMFFFRETKFHEDSNSLIFRQPDAVNNL